LRARIVGPGARSHGTLDSGITRCTEQTDRRIAWLRTRIDQAAPQAVVVPS
jgi:hypothetical protein